MVVKMTTRTCGSAPCTQMLAKVDGRWSRGSRLAGAPNALSALLATSVVGLAVAALMFSGFAGCAAVVAALFAGKAWRENRRSSDAAVRKLTGDERPGP